jgi:cell wall-associated NlpC family hydrolase
MTAAIVGVYAAQPAHADDSLTLDLPPSQKALEARAAQAKQQQQEQLQQANAAPSRKTVHTVGGFSGRATLPSRSGSPERVIGRLGEIVTKTAIFRSKGSGGKLATVDPGTYIAIKSDSSHWLGVLMADGTTGWISKDQVQVLDYQVVSSGTPTVPNVGGGSLQARTGSEFFTGNPQDLLREAYQYLGVPYQWGGNTVNGIDCSGFMKKIFASLGYSLPRTAAEQTNVGMAVPVDSLQCGDRLYFGRTRITHTGLYIGNGYFIHSSSGEHGVAISRLTDQPYQRIFNCARR